MSVRRSLSLQQGQVPSAALPNSMNMLGPQGGQLCPPVTQPPLHQTTPPVSTAAGMPPIQHQTPTGMTPPQPAAPTQPSTPVSSSGQTPTPTPGSVPNATQTQSTPTGQTAAQAQVTPQPQTPVQPQSVPTPQPSQQQPTSVQAQPPGTPVSISHLCFLLCRGVPQKSSLCIAPHGECVESLRCMAVDSSFYFRAKDSLSRYVKTCVQIISALFEGGGA